MNIEEIPTEGFERVVHCTDPDSGLNAFISVHDTTLGPALGGVRMLPYASGEEALADAMRLAKAMTYKAAVARTGQGGGKGVIVADPSEKTEAMMLAMGRLIKALDGQFIAAEDMNMTVADLETMARETRWVSGLSHERGSSGNPSPLTALGCLVGIQASAEEVFGTESLSGRCVAVQGVGAVGGALAKLCIEEGAEVAVCDLDGEKARRFADSNGATALEGPDACLSYPCDILSTCARGGILNAETIPKLQCRIVAGAANNQLDEPGDAERLQKRGILYAPDYVINAGGIINIACEFAPAGYSDAAARERVMGIGPTLKDVLRISREEDISTAAAADRLAEARLAEGRAANPPGS